MKIISKLLGAAFFICLAQRLQAQNQITKDTMIINQQERQIGQFQPVTHGETAKSRPSVYLKGFSQDRPDPERTDLTKLVPILIRTIREQEKEILTLRKMVETLQSYQWGRYDFTND